MINRNDNAPGSPSWWAAFAEFAAVRAWCYAGLGLHAEARRWQEICADASAAMARGTR